MHPKAPNTRLRLKTALPVPAPTKSPVRPILAWFRKHARDLPWRRTPDPYGIWIAEVMLQQTQVATVIPYWERWMRRLPTVKALAQADPDEILKLWEGLGYYSRARNLQAAAIRMASEGQGVVPNDFEALLRLPGIGRYTAGAICSIAFNQPVPAVDGNVIRVLTRSYGIEEDPNREKEKLWTLAEGLVQEASRHRANGRACSDFNQGLMELGALVCTPRSPDCPACPLRKTCIAFRTGRAESLPNLPPRPRQIPRRFAAFVIFGKDRVLLRRRSGGEVNAYLWEFPNVEVGLEEPGISKQSEACLGFAPASLVPWVEIRHTITRFRIRLEVFRGTAPAGILPSPRSGVWTPLDRLNQLAFPSAHRKIAALCARQRNGFVDKHDWDVLPDRI